MTLAQKALLAVTSGVGAALYPERADLVGAANETTGFFALRATRDRMPLEVVHAMAIVKKASARTNLSLGKLGADKCALIVRAADEVSERIVYERQVSACVCVCVCCAPGGGISGRQRSRRNNNIMNNDTQTTT